MLILPRPISSAKRPSQSPRTWCRRYCIDGQSSVPPLLLPVYLIHHHDNPLVQHPLSQQHTTSTTPGSNIARLTTMHSTAHCVMSVLLAFSALVVAAVTASTTSNVIGENLYLHTTWRDFN